MFNQGISYEGDVITTGLKYGVVKKAGASYSFAKERLGVGLEKAKVFLKENNKVMKEIVAEILKVIKEKEK